MTHCVWEGSQVVSEHDGTGAVLAEYIYNGGRTIAKVVGGTTQYFLSDRLSERFSLDANGNIIGRQAHLPFAEDFGESGTQEKHHFTNYERDAESALDYAVNRYHRVFAGRFDQVDRISGSIDLPQSMNRYSYGRNDPVNTLDPLGLFLFNCSGEKLLPWGFTFLLDGIEVPEIVCIAFFASFAFIPIFQGQRRPPLKYIKLDSYVTAFFQDPVNKDCAQDFKNRGVDLTKYLKKAENAQGLDFFNDNSFYHTTTFNAMPIDFFHPMHLSGPHSNESPSQSISGPVFIAAITFNIQNTIVIGTSFDNLPIRLKNQTIVHEVFHLLFNTPFHIPIAQQLGLGTKANEFEATKAIDDWLLSGCQKPKK